MSHDLFLDPFTIWESFEESSLALIACKPHIYNTSALHASLYECETWAIREWDKSKIKSVEVKFVGRMAK